MGFQWADDRLKMGFLQSVRSFSLNREVRRLIVRLFFIAFEFDFVIAFNLAFSGFSRS